MAKNRYKQVKKVFSISLGSRDRAFESPHSDQKPLKSVDFRGFFLTPLGVEKNPVLPGEEK